MFFKAHLFYGRWRYSDENIQDVTNEKTQTFDSAFSHKKITLEGVTCCSDIFSSKQFFNRQEMNQAVKHPFFGFDVSPVLIPFVVISRRLLKSRMTIPSQTIQYL
jgi:hypothetical protein